MGSCHGTTETLNLEKRKKKKRSNQIKGNFTEPQIMFCCSCRLSGPQPTVITAHQEGNSPTCSRAIACELPLLTALLLMLYIHAIIPPQSPTHYNSHCLVLMSLPRLCHSVPSLSLHLHPTYRHIASFYGLCNLLSLKLNSNKSEFTFDGDYFQLWMDTRRSEQMNHWGVCQLIQCPG